MTLGEKLITLRQQAGMSQEALAEKLNVSRQAISKWERDEAMPETENIVRLAKIFSVSTDYLLLPDSPSNNASRPADNQNHSTAAAFGRRIERFVRRHGYKAGYFLIGVGIFLCAVAILVWISLSQFGNNAVQTGNNPGGYGQIFVEGEGLDQNTMDAIIQQIQGSGWAGGYIDPFDQAVKEMETSWQNAIRIMATLFAVPLLLIGVAAIILGSFIVVKGRKIAAEAVS